MPHVYETAAVEILDWYHRAEQDLIGHPVVTFGGEAGTVKAVKFDEHHGLCFSLEDPVNFFDQMERGLRQRFWPVATIKFHGDKKA